MSIYENLIKDIGTLKDAEEESSGMDDFLSDNQMRLSENRMKISSMRDLLDFSRVSTETLVHKATKDLWKIGENDKGEVIIERLFDPDTKKPLKI